MRDWGAERRKEAQEPERHLDDVWRQSDEEGSVGDELGWEYELDQPPAEQLERDPCEVPGDQAQRDDADDEDPLLHDDSGFLQPDDLALFDRREIAAFLEQLPDNRPFTSTELAEIKRQNEALQAEVRTLTELNRQQQELIDRLLEEVQRGSERMGRKDWVMYAIGAATSLVIMEVVPPLVLLHLGVQAVHALGRLFEES
jgi:hypothetical protein